MSEKRNRRLTDSQQEKVLEEALRLWLGLESGNGNQISCLRKDVEIVRLLKKRGFETYNKGGKSFSTKITQQEFPSLRQLALDKVGVTVSLGKGEDPFIGNFECRKQLLLDKYRLKALYVPPPLNGVAANTKHFYEEAARCFQVTLNSSKEAVPKVSIGGGKTIFEMASYLSLDDRDFEVFNLNYATRLSNRDMFDSPYLAIAVNRLFRNSRSHIISFPPLPTNDSVAAASWHHNIYRSSADIREHFRRGVDTDIVFVGTGSFHKGSHTISRFYENVGISFEELDKFSPVGDINLCFFDKTGADITPEIFGSLKHRSSTSTDFGNDRDFTHPFLLGLNITRLRALTMSHKSVVLIAGYDAKKVNSIRTLVRNNIVNTLVTDEKTMDALLKE